MMVCVVLSKQDSSFFFLNDFVTFSFFLSETIRVPRMLLLNKPRRRKKIHFLTSAKRKRRRKRNR